MQKLDPVQHFTCTLCGEDWTRPTARGRTPRFCPACRERARQKRLTSCAWCGKSTLVRVDATACSRQCAMNLRARTSSPVIWRQCTACLTWTAKPGPRYRYDTCSASCKKAATLVFDPPRIPEARECPTCASFFTPRMPHSRYCGRKCLARAQRLRRRAREHGSYTEWRWSDFMRMARHFDYCCAYCGIKPDRLDPDHVIPLSRGGPNSISNLLPTCAACNSDKSALSLAEWASARAQRNLPPVRTDWDPGDSRYWHLTA